MAKENKVEYERVDEEGDEYKRVLVKFNPSFRSGSDFEIEFIPFLRGLEVGEAFIRNIDTMAAFDLYKWMIRQKSLTGNLPNCECGTIPTLEMNLNTARLVLDARKEGWPHIEPRCVVGWVKQLFDAAEEAYNKPIALAYNCFLLEGQLPSLPLQNKVFNVERLKSAIEDYEYLGFDAEGKSVKRSLVEHLFDTHKTEHLEINICRFLNVMFLEGKKIYEEKKKKGQW